MRGISSGRRPGSASAPTGIFRYFGTRAVFVKYHAFAAFIEALIHAPPPTRTFLEDAGMRSLTLVVLGLVLSGAASFATPVVRAAGESDDFLCTRFGG